MKWNEILVNNGPLEVFLRGFGFSSDENPLNEVFFRQRHSLKDGRSQFLQFKVKLVLSLPTKRIQCEDCK